MPLIVDGIAGVLGGPVTGMQAMPVVAAFSEGAVWALVVACVVVALVLLVALTLLLRSGGDDGVAYLWGDADGGGEDFGDGEVEERAMLPFLANDMVIDSWGSVAFWPEHADVRIPSELSDADPHATRAAVTVVSRAPRLNTLRRLGNDAPSGSGRSLDGWELWN
ncbi:MAG: hypothetical protein OJF49_003265 [Ktedonobacterales bacterium]|jgi:hypothetical protein|nr:MAG: hypothetical protein OJF49_003265 [Ktedonobacterales bacterium]